MAASGFTPLQTYYSSTATNAPLAANLAYGELAINITDGKLYYKDNTNVVRVIASTAGSSGSFTNISASGTITAGTNFIGPGTGLTGTATALSIGGTAALATSLAGGVAGAVPYQSATGVTGFSAAGTTGQFLRSAGTGSPTWATVATAVTITDQTVSSSTFYPVFYSSTSGDTNAMNVASTKLSFVPSTGTLSATVFSGAGTGLTGTAAALSIGGNAATATSATTASTVTTNANLTGVITSVGNATSIASQTGTGTKFVVDNTPTITTPVLTNPTVTNYVETLYTATGSTTINLANGTVQKITTSGTTTFTLPASVTGKSFTIIVAYAGADSIVFAGGTTIKWANNVVPVGTSATGKFDIFNFYQDGTNTYAAIYGQNF
jgi:hypothetical protein